MRAVSGGGDVSSKPVTLAKAARVFSLFAASDASGLPAEAEALVVSAAEAAAGLHAFRLNAGEGEGSERWRKKRKKKSSETERDTANRDVRFGMFLSGSCKHRDPVLRWPM